MSVEKKEYDAMEVFEYGDGKRLDIVKSVAGNVYGGAEVWKTSDGRCWFGVEGMSNLMGFECSPEFYESFKSEWESRTV